MDSKFEHNYKLLLRYHRSIALEVNAIRKKGLENELKIEAVPNKEGGLSLAVMKKEGARKLMLSGIYEPSSAAHRILEGWGKLSLKTPFIIMGMGNLLLIEECVEKAQDGGIVVIYESSIEIFQQMMESYDLGKIFDDQPVYLFVEGINDDEMESFFPKILNIDTISLLKIIISPNYTELFPVAIGNKMKLLKKKFADLIVQWNTAMRYTDVVGKNTLYNLKHQFEGYNVSQLHNFLGGEIPAFIVSAGPSLNKNIMELKKVGNRGCIIAVDTAIKPLLNNGIVPDFFVIVDGKKPTELMNHPGINEVPLVTSTVVAEGIMDLHKGKKFFYRSGSTLETVIDQEIYMKSASVENVHLASLPTGGSVANTAFTLGKYMNASELIFVGQDLALTNNQTHANGTFKKKMDKLTNDELSHTIEVEGIHGNMVLTRQDFKHYLTWFEDYIRDREVKHVYDATQGGARIHGTKLITLRTAINRFCVKDYDIQNKLEELPRMYTKSAQQVFLEEYKEMPVVFQKVKHKAATGFRLYSELYQLLEQEDYDIGQYRKLLKNIGVSNKYMNEDLWALYVQENMVKLNYTVRNSIYEESESEIEDLRSLALQGKLMNREIWHYSYMLTKYTERLIQDRPLHLSEIEESQPLEQLLELLKGIGGHNE